MINTYSSFYYLNPVTQDNFYLNFNEGGGELTAQLEAGHYTHSELAQAIQDALNDAGALAYTVTFLRNDRKFQISAPSNFSLLISSGTNASSSIFSLIGFTGADLTGVSSYTGNAQSGSEYIPQFWLQDWVDPEDLQKGISPAVNKSAAGEVEVVRFGTEKFYEFTIKFITDVDQGSSGPVLNNSSGVNDARLFMRFCVTKQKLEFMPDKNNKAVFTKIRLESTEESRDGTGYRLRELYTQGLPYYWETGKLVYRLVED